jgi:ABC transporter
MTAQGTAGGDIISVDGLCMRYRALDVLRDVGFRVRRGEVVALLGPNGAGKATTVEILEGFRRPSAGQVRVLDANPISGDRRWRARTGIVLQSWRDHGRWQVREFLACQASYYRPYGTESSTRSSLAWISSWTAIRIRWPAEVIASSRTRRSAGSGSRVISPARCRSSRVAMIRVLSAPAAQPPAAQPQVTARP